MVRSRFIDCPPPPPRMLFITRSAVYLNVLSGHISRECVCRVRYEYVNVRLDCVSASELAERMLIRSTDLCNWHRLNNIYSNFICHIVSDRIINSSVVE